MACSLACGVVLLLPTCYANWDFEAGGVGLHQGTML